VELIFHITPRSDWDAAVQAGEYRLSTKGRSLEDVGFIHCSSAGQVARIANAVYPGVSGLVVLAIAQDRLHSEVRWEHPASEDELFPHIYGPLNIDAVTVIYPLEPGADGSFDFPISEE
jgi:uncharacterized protein (DUF952 family)